MAGEVRVRRNWPIRPACSASDEVSESSVSQEGGFTDQLLLCHPPGMERDQAPVSRVGIDPKRVVESGYDRIARRYLEWSDLKPSAVRTWFLGEVLDRLAPGSDVLELGCGSGLPVMLTLVWAAMRLERRLFPASRLVAESLVRDLDSEARAAYVEGHWL